MMTSIGEVTVGTLLKRFKTDGSPSMTKGKIYEVVKIVQPLHPCGYGLLVNNDHGKEWAIDLRLYKIVGHVDDNIIQELDQMLEFCLKYNEIESYIVNKA